MDVAATESLSPLKSKAPTTSSLTSPIPPAIPISSGRPTEPKGWNWSHRPTSRCCTRTHRGAQRKRNLQRLLSTVAISTPWQMSFERNYSGKELNPLSHSHCPRKLISSTNLKLTTASEPVVKSTSSSRNAATAAVLPQFGAKIAVSVRRTANSSRNRVVTSLFILRRAAEAKATSASSNRWRSIKPAPRRR